MDDIKQQQAIDKAYSCAKHWPFLRKLQLQPTSEATSENLTRLANTGQPLTYLAAFQILNDDVLRLAASCAAFFDRNHMSSWQCYRAEHYINFRTNWDSIAGDDLQMLLTWLTPPNCDDVPYELLLGLDTAARLFINTQMLLVLERYGDTQDIAVVLQFMRGCHVAAWQTIKWELQRATARHRKCRCERCIRRDCYDRFDASFADLSCIALGTSSRLEKTVSRGSLMQRLKASLGKRRPSAA